MKLIEQQAGRTVQKNNILLKNDKVVEAVKRN